MDPESRLYVATGRPKGIYLPIEVTKAPPNPEPLNTVIPNPEDGSLRVTVAVDEIDYAGRKIEPNQEKYSAEATARGLFTEYLHPGYRDKITW